MDKLVLIGNGFDLAHDLPTSYQDFMTFVKDSIVGHIDKTNFLRSSPYFHEFDKDVLPRDILGVSNKYIGFKLSDENPEFQFIVKPGVQSIYLRSLFDKFELTGIWSDLESHYFQILKLHSENPNGITVINDELKQLQILLASYLNSQVENNIGVSKEYQFDIHGSPILDMLIHGHNDFGIFEHNYFVSFNYTSVLLEQYIGAFQGMRNQGIQGTGKSSFDIQEVHAPIYIHGTLERGNPIIFGYGDENTNEYIDLSSIGNNELLENFKTFKYLRTNNYQSLLGILEKSEDLYVQILGHSCGLTDKALLKVIFEHPSVTHIEASYHGGEKNYFEKLYNISRIFDDKNLMRKKLVNMHQTFKMRRIKPVHTVPH